MEPGVAITKVACVTTDYARIKTNGRKTRVRPNTAATLYKVATEVVHAKADATNTVSTVDATAVQAEINTLANEIKTDFNNHNHAAGVHWAVDPADVDTAAASDKDTSIALLNALQVAFNAHVASTAAHGVGSAMSVLAPLVTADSLTTIKDFANDLKAKYNAHCALVASAFEQLAAGEVFTYEGHRDLFILIGTNGDMSVCQ